MGLIEFLQSKIVFFDSAPLTYYNEKIINKNCLNDDFKIITHQINYQNQSLK
jgi:hypothetical protein